MNTEIKDELNNTMDFITKDTPNVSTMNDMSRHDNVLEVNPVGDKTIEDKTTDDMATDVIIENNTSAQTSDDNNYDTNIVVSSSDKVSSDKMSMDNNIVEAKNDEIQVVNSQIPIQQTATQNNSSSSITRTRSPKKLENFFKKNQKSPLRRNHGMKPWSGDTSRNLQDDLTVNSKIETADGTNNDNENLDTQEENTDSNIKNMLLPNISSSPKGDMLNDFDVSPPDTPESQRILPNENLENIKDLIEPQSEDDNNDNNNDEKGSNKSIETSKLHTDDIFPVDNNSRAVEDLTTQLIAQTEISQNLNKKDTSQKAGEKFAKVSLNLNRNLNFVMGQTTQEQIESVESLIETNVANLDNEQQEDNKESATGSNHWRFLKSGNEQELETYDRTTQLIRQPIEETSKSMANVNNSNNNKATQLIPIMSTQTDILPHMTDKHISTNTSHADLQDSMAVVSEINEVENTTTELKSQNEILTNDLNINDDSLNNTSATKSLVANESETLNRSKVFQLEEISQDSSPVRTSADHTSYNEPLEKSLSNVSSPKPVSTVKKRKFLKITYAKDSEQNMMDNSLGDRMASDKSNVVVSDFEGTQELPDIPEPDLEDSQNIVIGRNKRKRFIPNLQLSEEHESSEKTSTNETRSFREHPNTIKEIDDRKLTRKDVVFNNAVWCQYDNFHYYPGIIRNVDRSENKYEILFDRDRYMANPEHLYYLNIAIGDIVTYETSAFVVVALECQTQDPSVIRCIRGYDTVHLRKASNSKKNVVIPLSWLYISLDVWSKRKHIPLMDELDSDDANNSEEFTPTALRKTRVGSLGTPRKKRRVNYVESDDESNNDPDEIKDPEFNESQNNIISGGILEPNEIRASSVPITKNRNITTRIERTQSNIFNPRRLREESDTKVIPKAINSALLGNSNVVTNIFEGCLFVITGYREIGDELKDTIVSYGGDVIDTGFSNLFSFYTKEGQNNSKFQRYSMLLEWKNKAKYSNFRFACVISDRYSRSPKYLEALALRWPTLQRRFIHECIFSGKVDESIISRYLLPSGESTRLDDMFTTPFIKSNSAFHFLTNFVNKRSLNDQINLSSTTMNKLAVVICQDSNLTNFAKFMFACFGTKQLVQLSNINCLKTNNTSFTEIYSVLRRLQDEGYNLLFYLNDGPNDNDPSRIIEAIKCNLKSGMPEIQNYYIKDREWLIQSIINEHTELS
ncbi:hypothetical protein C6P45_004278 [Maudiozyma exigua]|uniref:BRCT domain-containing protein n=1 Tax=Maudiozyma exigua TaxID=34358 RepID=A0A9P6WC13_MAUEX|nr:hypothetical protein C6P45_004278 [Kazachstania exigua]